MRFVIVTIGSRGDVQPYIALGIGLQAAGHQVTIATHRLFESFVCEWGLDFAPIAGDPREFLAMLTESELGINTLRFSLLLLKWTSAFMDEALHDFVEACREADVIVATFLGIAAQFIGEAQHKAVINAFLMPIHRPTSAYPSVNAFLPFSLGGWYNRLTYHLESQLGMMVFRRAFNRWRVESLGLAPIAPLVMPYNTLHGKPIPTIYGYSPQIIPQPRDWGDEVKVTGYWFLHGQSHWQAPSDLVAFLEAGAPPIYIGFGSLINEDSAAMLELVLEALTLSGQRGLLLTGWGDWSKHRLPDSVYVLDGAPHDWLFPRMATVIHHGGAGTTAAGLWAGKPTIIIPFFGDQPFWGRRVAASGVGTAPIVPRKLTARNLAQAITETITNQPMRQRAAALGARIQAEDGVREAVSFIERHVI